MAQRTKTKATTKRTKVKDLPKPKRELTGQDLKKVQGGSGFIEQDLADKNKYK